MRQEITLTFNSEIEGIGEKPTLSIFDHETKPDLVVLLADDQTGNTNVRLVLTKVERMNLAGVLYNFVAR